MSSQFVSCLLPVSCNVSCLKHLSDVSCLILSQPNPKCLGSSRVLTSVTWQCPCLGKMSGFHHSDPIPHLSTLSCASILIPQSPTLSVWLSSLAWRLPVSCITSFQVMRSTYRCCPSLYMLLPSIHKTRRCSVEFTPPPHHTEIGTVSLSATSSCMCM